MIWTHVSMTNRLEITPEAERDIFAITANIYQQVGITAAKRTILELKNQLNTLAEFADSGRIGGCEGTREVVMTGMPYIAVYEKSDTLLTIIRVLYGANEREQEAR